MAGTSTGVRFGAPVRGDVVRVKSQAEILATLDADGTTRSLPFMPEMLKYCGQELGVTARAEKACDTIDYTGNRRMEGTVHLEGARCDGSAHGGCQAGCLLFWREEWLERSDSPAASRAQSGGSTVDTLMEGVQTTDESGETVYRCQATELLRASSAMSQRSPVQYVRDLKARNIGPIRLLHGLLVVAFNKYQRFSLARFPARLRIRGGQPYPFLRGTGTGERTPTVDLQPGEVVEVRSKAEILATLGPDNRNRQMFFDSEMLPFCGKQARVERQVGRIIDERTGKMIKLRDCVVLEGVVCTGIYHKFCTRAISPYWREAWLRRVEEPAAGQRFVAAEADA